MLGKRGIGPWSLGAFDLKTGKSLKRSSAVSATEIFSKKLVELATNDRKSGGSYSCYAKGGNRDLN